MSFAPRKRSSAINVCNFVPHCCSAEMLKIQPRPNFPASRRATATISSTVAGRAATAPVFAMQFRFVQLVVAANQNDDRFAVGDVNQRLDLAIGRNFVRLLAQRLDGHDAGRGKFFNGRADFARGGFGNAARRLLDVRRVTARLRRTPLRSRPSRRAP